MSECPRWRLTAPHYLNIPVHPDGTKTQWEHTETDRTTGRAARTQYTVPLMLDNRVPSDFNYPEDGDIIVALKVDGASFHRRDYIFTGDPTPDMEPLNDEAQAITDSLRTKWEHPINSLPANGGMNQQETLFMEAMMKAFAGAQAQQVVPNASVPKAEYDALKERLERLEAAIAVQAKPESVTARRA